MVEYDSRGRAQRTKYRVTALSRPRDVIIALHVTVAKVTVIYRNFSSYRTSWMGLWPLLNLLNYFQL